MSPDPIVKLRKSNTKADAKWLSKITANFTICHETGKEMGEDFCMHCIKTDKDLIYI